MLCTAPEKFNQSESLTNLFIFIFLFLSFFQKKYKMETEVENWIQKYDSEMSEKQVMNYLQRV